MNATIMAAKSRIAERKISTLNAMISRIVDEQEPTAEAVRMIGRLNDRIEALKAAIEE